MLRSRLNNWGSWKTEYDNRWCKTLCDAATWSRNICRLERKLHLRNWIRMEDRMIQLTLTALGLILIGLWRRLVSSSKRARLARLQCRRAVVLTSWRKRSRKWQRPRYPRWMLTSSTWRVSLRSRKDDIKTWLRRLSGGRSSCSSSSKNEKTICIVKTSMQSKKEGWQR